MKLKSTVAAGQENTDKKKDLNYKSACQNTIQKVH